MTIDEILDAIEPHGCNLVEITGGEPMMQEEIPKLSKKLLEKGYIVLIETGGSLDVSSLPSEVVKILDIKCPDSGMTEHMNWENLKYLGPKDEIKFVINSRKDYEWSIEVMNRYQLDKKNLILFSPVYQKMPADQLAEWILADKLQVRFQIQLHKALWGETPGR
jgi:7-carboxy-7-deazaguanine synthase